MKKIFLLSTLFAPLFSNAQYFEDFENGVPGGMIEKYQKEETTWINFGLSAIYVEKPISGSNSAIFFNGMATGEVITSLETPVLDLSSPYARLEFKHLQKERNIGYSNKLIVELSNDLGKTWETIGKYSETGDNIKKEHIDLAFFKPTKNSIIRFKATQSKVDMGYPIVLDDIEIANDSDAYIKKIDFENSKNDIKIYPNPSSGKFKIETATTIDVIIFNTEGKVIKTINQASNDTIIDLSQATKGIYFVKIIKNNSEEIQKIILN